MNVISFAKGAQQPQARLDFLVLLTTSLVSSLIMLDSNIVAVSLPAIAKSLGANFVDIEWVVSAYVLAYTALLLASGALADLIGRRKVMLTGLVIFAAASAVCGIANSPAMLNISRAVQGVGGAMLLTSALAIISNTFSGPARAKAFGFWGACLGIALTAGPILGGIITNLVGWRWVFLVNVPICVILIAATIVVIRESHDENAHKLDIVGILTFSPGLFLLIWALIDGNDAGWASISILLRFAGAVVLFVGFVIGELRQARPMVDFGLFRRPTFLGSVFAMVGYGGSAQVMIFYLPLYLQNTYGFAPAWAGLAMIPFALPMVIVPRFTAGLSSRYSGRVMLTAGLLVAFAGNVLFWTVAQAGLPYSAFIVSMLVAGAGAGMLNGETVKVLQGSVPPERAGMASGLASTTRFIGVLVGVAGLGAVLANVTRTIFDQFAMTRGLTDAAAEHASQLVTSGDLTGMLAGVPNELRAVFGAAGHAAFAGGFAAATLTAAVVSLVAAALTWAFVGSVDTAPNNGAAQVVPSD